MIRSPVAVPIIFNDDGTVVGQRRVMWNGPLSRPPPPPLFRRRTTEDTDQCGSSRKQGTTDDADLSGSSLIFFGGGFDAQACNRIQSPIKRPP